MSFGNLKFPEFWVSEIRNFQELCVPGILNYYFFVCLKSQNFQEFWVSGILNYQTFEFRFPKFFLFWNSSLSEIGIFEFVMSPIFRVCFFLKLKKILVHPLNFCDKKKMMMDIPEVRYIVTWSGNGRKTCAKLWNVIWNEKTFAKVLKTKKNYSLHFYQPSY